MTFQPRNYTQILFDTWERYILRHSWTVLCITILLCIASLHYTAHNLGINTNTAEMLDPELAFQQNRLRVDAAFPEAANAIIIVVDAATPEESTLAANSLAQQLKLQPNIFTSVQIPSENDFFKQQALLYLSTPELLDLSDKLTQAQPFIGYLTQNYHLEGLFYLVKKALDPKEKTVDLAITPLLTAINQTFSQSLHNQAATLSWQNLFTPNSLNSEAKRQLIMVKPILDFEQILPAAAALNSIRAIVHTMTSQNPHLQIHVTGEVALEHEELESVTAGSEFAGIVSLILVCSALWFGLRSIKLLIATFLSLIFGLILTAGFAALALGHLNIISIAFAVLYIGLGVDYAIHICLHYRAYRAQGFKNLAAIIASIREVGFAIFLCTITTSIGFLVFIPTDYAGVSELGLISGVGMFISLGISLIVLPALLKLLNIQAVNPLPHTQKPLAITNIPLRFAKPIQIFAILLALGSPFVLVNLEFDSHSLNLRDPSSESVITMQDLLRSKTNSPFTLTTLSADLNTAKTLAAQLRQLDSVNSVTLLSDLVATEQTDKILIIEDLALILGNKLDQLSPNTSTLSPKQVLQNFQLELQNIIQTQLQHPDLQLLVQLHQNIQAFIQIANNQPYVAYPALELNLLGLLPHTLERLQLSLNAYEYILNDIPAEISQQWRSKDGLYRILIAPKFDQNDLHKQHEFVQAVQAIDPTVTGLAVADKASGDAVVGAFIQAFSAAFIAIILLLFFILRNIKQTLLVICPLILMALLTGSSNVLLDNPFNFANIIALPLLMGMGVDSSIHIMHSLKNDVNILQSSTARGIFFSSITTMCSFSSLAFTPHVGTSSMGLLLAQGIFFTLFCTLIVLPAFIGKPSN